jgi:HK97 family phage major capsid protein
VQTLIAKRASLLNQAKTIANDKNFSKESRAKFDAVMAEVSQVDAQIAVDQRSNEATLAEQRRYRPNPGESNDAAEGVEVRNAKQKANLRHYMLTGEVRDLNASAQGVAIPVGFNPQVIDAQLSYGELYNCVEVLKTDNGEPIKYVFDDDTTNGLAAVTSGTDAAETDPALSGATINVDNFTTGVIKVDMALMQDAGFDIDGWVRDKFGKRFFRGASSLIYNGNGSNVASYKSAISQSVTAGTAGKITYADLVAAQTALDPAWQNSAEWGMSQGMLGNVLNITDTNNRPVFLPDFGSASKGFVGTILGKPVRMITQMPSAVATGAQLTIYGSHRDAYVLRQVNPGLGIIRLNERYAAGFQIGFVAFARLGGMSKQVGSAKPAVSVIGK